MSAENVLSSITKERNRLGEEAVTACDRMPERQKQVIGPVGDDESTESNSMTSLVTRLIGYCTEFNWLQFTLKIPIIKNASFRFRACLLDFFQFH